MEEEKRTHSRGAEAQGTKRGGHHEKAGLQKQPKENKTRHGETGREGGQPQSAEAQGT